MRTRGENFRSFCCRTIVSLLVYGAASGCFSDPSGPSVLLVTFDTVRADHFGCYGNVGAFTPHTDGLAREGVLFENCFSPVPLTLPAHASILTGRYPFRHGVRDNSLYELETAESTLAEAFSDYGLHTAAFVSTAVLSERHGLGQGFALYDDRLPSRAVGWGHERRAGDTAAAVTTWLKKNGSNRFFLWVHIFDPHQAYDPPPPWDERFAHDLYSGEIAYADDSLGQILQEVDLGRCLVVVAGDHGESLGEHDEPSHGFFTYSSTLRVPLVIRYPDAYGAGSRVTGPVSLVDIAPTILGYLGYPSGKEIDGQNLRSLMEGPPVDRRIYFETAYPLNFGWSPLVGVRTSGWHFVQAPEPELYQVADDPHEERNVIDLRADVAADLAGHVQLLEPFANIGKRSATSTSMEEQEMLLALGYAGSGTTVVPEDLPGLPDPKAMLGCFNRYLDIEEISKLGRWEEAIAEYSKLSEACASAYPIRQLHAIQLREAGRFEEAIAALEWCRAERPEDLLVWITLAKSLIVGGFPVRAVELCGIGLDRFGDEPALWAEKGTAHRLLGELDTALSCCRKAVELAPDDADSLASLGAILLVRQELEEAIEVLRRALEFYPESSFAWFNLGRALLEVGDFEAAEEAFERVTEVEDHDEAWLQLAKVWLVRSKPEAALPVIQDLLVKQPEDHSLFYLKGEAYRQMGEAVEAEHAFRAFLQIEPSHPTALLRLIEVLLDQNPPRVDAAREVAVAARTRGVDVPKKIRRRLDLK